MFGDTEVWIAVIEWGSSMDLDILSEPTEAEIQAATRGRVIETFMATVPEYDPDGCREFVLAESELDDAAWLAELRDLTTQPWITIERHVVPINPASPINPDRPNLGQEEGPQDEHDD